MTEHDPAPQRVGPVATVWRGARGRCGRCGRRGIFDGYFTLKERCPTCGVHLQREEGFMTGVYLVNFTITIAALWLLLMVWVLWRAGTDSSSAVWPVLVVACAIAVVFPIAGYPRAASTWSALDLAMRPLDPDEEADATTWVAAQGDR